MIFRDRKEAGMLLSEAVLRRFRGSLVDPVVIAIPRGGVVVAEQIALALSACLDLVIPRKIGAPFNPEFAVAAVTEDGTLIRNPSISGSYAENLGITEEYLKEKAKEELKEIERRRMKYMGGRKRVSVKGRDVILVDDGIATGLTIRAGIESLRKDEPRMLILAVPVMPADKVRELEEIADHTIVLHAPEYFSAVGQFYRDFSQTTDEEVIEIVKRLHC